ncbi:MAG: hypothetical protein ACJARL_003053 [Halopseudomonas sp.]|jgi:hypothetical protein
MSIIATLNALDRSWSVRSAVLASAVTATLGGFK